MYWKSSLFWSSCKQEIHTHTYNSNKPTADEQWTLTSFYMIEWRNPHNRDFFVLERNEEKKTKTFIRAANFDYFFSFTLKIAAIFYNTFLFWENLICSQNLHTNTLTNNTQLMLRMCKASRKKSEIKTMNSNPPLFLVVKFKNVNKKSKTITEKNMTESHYCNLTTRKTQRILKERGRSATCAATLLF